MEGMRGVARCNSGWWLFGNIVAAVVGYANFKRIRGCRRNVGSGTSVERVFEFKIAVK